MLGPGKSRGFSGLKPKRITRGKAIRMKCLECSGGQRAEVRLCEMRECPLWPFRLGKEITDQSQDGLC